MMWSLKTWKGNKTDYRDKGLSYDERLLALIFLSHEKTESKLKNTRSKIVKQIITLRIFYQIR